MNFMDILFLRIAILLETPVISSLVSSRNVEEAMLKGSRHQLTVSNRFGVGVFLIKKSWFFW